MGEERQAGLMEDRLGLLAAIRRARSEVMVAERLAGRCAPPRVLYQLEKMAARLENMQLAVKVSGSG